MASDRPGLRLTGDWRRLERTLDNMADPPWEDIHEEIGVALVGSTQERFKKSEGPDGKRWPRAKRRAGQVLLDTGRLRASIHSQADETEVVVGSDVVYARHQHFGSPDRDKLGRSLNLPPRPFIGVSTDDEQEIADIVLDAIKEMVE